MKTSILNLLLCIGFLASCNSDDLSETDVLSEREIAVFVENPYAMNESDAVVKATLFLNNAEVSLRSSNSSETVNAFVSTRNYEVKIPDLSSEENEVKQVVPVYTVNYKDNSNESGGFVLIAGDERITDNVLIFNDNGNFDFSRRNDVDFLDDLISGFLYKEINFEFEEEESLNENTGISTRAHYITDYGNSSMYLLYPTIEFEQSGLPFNWYTPFRNGQRALAGCTAVAMSEIMAHHAWPLQGAFKRYTTNTVTPETVYVSYELTTAEWAGIRSSNMSYCANNYPIALEYVANIIAETGYKLNSSYGTDVTTAYPNDVPYVFQQMGYTTGAYQSYSFAAIQDDIEVEEIPVFMAGWKNANDPYVDNNGDNGGHAYVLMGTLYESLTGKTFICLINMYVDPVTGYGNYWFNNAMFTATNTTPSYTPTGNDMVYPYRYQCGIITDIKPDPNNTGSTNPNWRSRSINAY
ncbi:MAG: C10 family peptidase [Tannerella sp.]|jgi:hypothetical protein|nr:C10 family peptidase [Tannerella sp.]